METTKLLKTDIVSAKRDMLSMTENVKDVLTMPTLTVLTIDVNANQLMTGMQKISCVN